MIRPSSLNIASKCSLSPVLSEQFGRTSEAAARGTEVDRQVCDWVEGKSGEFTDPDVMACCAWLKKEMLDKGWALSVHRQITVCHPDTGGILTKGTPDIVGYLKDMVWVVDLKKREQYWAGLLTDIDEDLQTHAYALGAIRGTKAACYKKSYLLFGDGEADAKTSILFGPEQWAEIYEKIREIQLAKVKATKGDHCLRCYGRQHCTAWLLPAYEGTTALAPFTAPQGLTQDNAAQALDVVQAMKTAVEAAETQLREYAKREGGIVVGNRRWACVQMPGRESVDVARLKRDGLADQYTKKGAPFEQMRWLRADKR